MKIENQTLLTEKRRSLRGFWVVILVLLLAAVGMTLWSMFVYLRAAWPAMQHDQ